MESKLARAPKDCLPAFEHELDHVYQSLRRHGLPAPDAEDLAQEVFLIAWRRWGEYDPRRPLRPWLAGIAFRLAHHHRRRRDREVPGGLVDLVDEQPTPEDHAAGSSRRALVWRVLQALPERERELLRLHDIEDVPMRDIAEELRIPLQTAHTRLRSGRRNFGRLLRRLATVSDVQVALRGTALLRQLATEPAPADRRQRMVARLRALVLLLPPSAGRGVRPPGDPRGAAAADAGGVRGLAGAALARAIVYAGIAALWAMVASRGPRHAGAELATSPGEQGGSSGQARGRGTPPRFVTAPAPSAARPGSAAEEDGAGDGLVGHWTFDEGTGAVAADSSGHGNHCLIRGAEGAQRWTEGPVDGALELTGEVWLECPRVGALAALSREVTIALWIRRTGSEGGVRALVSRPLDGTDEDRFRLGFRGERLWLRSMTAGTAAGGAPLLARSRWYHVAGTLSRDGTARVFVDGVEVGSRQVSGRPPFGGGAGPLLIGAALQGKKVAHQLRGIVDDLVLYDHALSAAQIRALAERGDPPAEPATAAGPAAVATAEPGAVAAEPDQGPVIPDDPAVAGAIAVEAEAGTVSAPLQVRRDPGASGGRYVAVAPGINAKEAAPSAGQAVIPFALPAAGRYRLWGRVSAPTPEADSFWVRLDRGPWLRWNGIAPGASWHWDLVQQDREPRVSSFDLAAGSHTLTVAYREDGARLDRMLLSSDPGFRPRPAVSPEP